jgi:ubiquinone/menaquinone biosynthesis C-methylase UbiE
MSTYTAGSVAPEDQEFFKLLQATAEFEPNEASYRKFMSFNMRAVERGRLLASRLAKRKPLAQADALDLGAGSGGLAIALAEQGANVTAIEPDEGRRRWAQTRIAGYGASVDLRDGVAEHLPFTDASFDLVTLDSILEHVESPALTISEVARVLRPGGLAYLTWPNKSSVPSIFKDPHYQMFGVVLMPHWLGKFYVERVRRGHRGYWVNVIPTRQWVQRRMRNHSLRPERLVPEGLEKISDPESIGKSPKVRAAARAAKRLGLSQVLLRAAVAQYANHVYLAWRI